MIKTGIHTIYHGVVVVPWDVYDAFGHTKEYERFSCNAMTNCNVGAAGSHAYSEHEEWCDDSDRRCVEHWVQEWVTQIKRWQAELANQPKESDS